MDYGCHINELYTSACIRPVQAADIQDGCLPRSPPGRNYRLV